MSVRSTQKRVEILNKIHNTLCMNDLLLQNRDPFFVLYFWTPTFVWSRKNSMVWRKNDSGIFTARKNLNLTLTRVKIIFHRLICHMKFEGRAEIHKGLSSSKGESRLCLKKNLSRSFYVFCVDKLRTSFCSFVLNRAGSGCRSESSKM